MKMLGLGFAAVMCVSSVGHASPALDGKPQGPGLLPKIGCPPGQVAVPVYNAAGVIIRWQCGRAV